MEEKSPTRKYRQHHEVNVLFQPPSLRRRRIDRTSKGNMQRNFKDFEYERNTRVKQYYTNKISPTLRERPETFENVSKGLDFKRQNHNCIQSIKTAATQKRTTPGNKRTTSNLQIRHDTRKSKSNHRKHLESIGKEYNKITQINAFNLHGVRARTDTLAMNERAGAKEILQQNIPSSSKDQSGKLYQNNKVIDETFTRRYMEKPQNSSVLREKSCKKSFITYKQIFKEARELHRQMMANNILWPQGKGVSHSPRGDMFVSSHNVYAPGSKGTIN